MAACPSFGDREESARWEHISSCSEHAALRGACRVWDRAALPGSPNRWLQRDLYFSYTFIFFPGSWLWTKWKKVYSDHTVDVLVREEERFHSY